MSVEFSLLGKDTDYPTQYQPELLFPIARAESRHNYAHIAGISQGKDWWHIFEISWLNAHGVPQVAIGRLTLPASSPNLIESKSLKLYFNSLNFSRFDTAQDFIATVERDLSAAAGAKLELQLFHADDLAISKPTGICLDALIPERLSAQPDANLLQFDAECTDQVDEKDRRNIEVRSGAVS